jgi:hypothetical protein
MRIIGRISPEEFILKRSQYQDIIDAIMQTPVGEIFAIECDTKQEANRYRNRARDMVNAKEIIVRTRIIKQGEKYRVAYLKVNEPSR